MTRRSARSRRCATRRGRRLCAEPLEARLALNGDPVISSAAIGAAFESLYPNALNNPDPVARAAIAAITTTAPANEYFFIVDPQPSAPDIGGAPTPPFPEPGQLINLPAFRDDPRFAGIDGRGFAVVILDTGMDLDHPFFGPDLNDDDVADRVVFNADFVDGAPNANDLNGHGTHVTSILASEDVTFDGVARGVNIIHLRVLNNAGSGSAAALESALQWVVANVNTYNIVSVNMSLSFGDNLATKTTRPELGISDELAALAAQDVIVASASGNLFFPFQSSLGVAYPSADPNSLSVGATWNQDVGGPIVWGSGARDVTTGPDRLVSFTQRHPTLTTVVAPGAPIGAAAPGGGAVRLSGTSMAAPVVTGVAALMQQLSVRITGARMSASQFANLIRVTGAPLFDGDNEDDNVANTQQVYHRVDVLAMANAVLSGGLADLTMPFGVDLSSPSTPAGGMVRADFTIANQGATATGAFSSKIYLSTDANIDSSDVLLAELNDQLGPGQAIARSRFTAPLPAGIAPGNYFLGIRIDAQGAVTESGEANNVVIRPLSVTGSSGEIFMVDVSSDKVVVDGVTAIDFGQVVQGLAGAERTFRIHNDGNVNLILNGASLPAGFAVVDFPSSVAPGASAEFKLTLSSNNAAGDFAGEASFGVNDLDENPFNFTVRGTVVEPDDHGDDAAHATEVAGTSTNAGLISDPTDVDWFRFAAVAGIAYRFETALETLGDSALRLWAPDGVTELAANDNVPPGLASRIEWVAPADGQYYLEVRGVAGADGAYQLALVADDDYGNDASTSEPSTDPSSVLGVVETPGDRDWFAFHALAGVRYEFSTTLTTLLDSVLRVIDRDGASVLGFNDDDVGTRASRLEWTAPKDGLYYVVVEASDPQMLGAYGLRLEGGDDHGDNSANATPAVLPASIGGAVDHSFDVDWFSFTATAGAQIRFAVSLGSLADSVLRLVGPDGTTELVLDDDSGPGLSSEIIWMAPSEGVYFVEVSGLDWRSGSYNLAITVLDDHGDNASTATVTTDPSANPGIIELAADVDWFAVDAVAGVLYRATTSLFGLSGSALRVYGPDGVTQVAQSSNGADSASFVAWTATQNGRYYVEVAAAAGAQPGGYQLAILGNDDHGDNPQNASPLPVPGNVSGNIEQAGDRDWFSFVSSVGVEYEFKLASNVVTHPVIRLVAGDGATQILAHQGGEGLPASIQWVAPNNDKYYLEVSATGGIDGAPVLTGAYQIVAVTVGFLSGDYDFDANVDGSDFLVWQRGLGSTSNLAADGNANGVVDSGDLAVWREHFGQSVDPAGISAVLFDSSQDEAALHGAQGAAIVSAADENLRPKSPRAPWRPDSPAYDVIRRRQGLRGGRTARRTPFDVGALTMPRVELLDRSAAPPDAHNVDVHADETPLTLDGQDVDDAIADMFGDD